ncbi:hypothetical protein D3C71_2141350 [compost metagenome]
MPESDTACAPNPVWSALMRKLSKRTPGVMLHAPFTNSSCTYNAVLVSVVSGNRFSGNVSPTGGVTPVCRLLTLAAVWSSP